MNYAVASLALCLAVVAQTLAAPADYNVYAALSQSGDADDNYLADSLEFLKQFDFDEVERYVEDVEAMIDAKLEQMNGRTKDEILNGVYAVYGRALDMLAQTLKEENVPTDQLDEVARNLLDYVVSLEVFTAGMSDKEFQESIRQAARSVKGALNSGLKVLKKMDDANLVATLNGISKEFSLDSSSAVNGILDSGAWESLMQGPLPVIIPNRPVP